MLKKEEEKVPKAWLPKSEAQESKDVKFILGKGQMNLKKEENADKKEFLDEFKMRGLLETEDRMTEDIDPNDVVMRDQSGGEALEIEDHVQYTPHVVELMEVEISITQPEKRPRVFMDFISIPSRQTTSTTVLEESIEEMNEKMTKLKNNENLVFNIDTVRERLRNGPGLDIFPVTLDKSIRDEGVSRKFMSATKEVLGKHGLNDWLYLGLDYHPSAPEVPGAPGLFFSVNGNATDWEGKFRVFTRIHPNPAIWQYMGQYELKSCPSLTKEEWRQQPYKVRSTWGMHACKHAWGISIRARIALKKQLKRDPTEAEFNAGLESGVHQNVTPDDVIDGFSNGDPIMSIWTMKCVGYEADFQCKVVDEFSTWVPPPSKPKKPKKDIKPRGKKEREPTPNSSDSEDDGIEPQYIELSD